MLVCDPDRRYTVAQIKRHRWVQVEVPPTAAAAGSTTAATAASTTGTLGDVKSGRKCDVPINERLMKVMGDLGIDTNMTREVIKVSYPVLRIKLGSENPNSFGS